MAKTDAFDVMLLLLGVQIIRTLHTVKVTVLLTLFWKDSRSAPETALLRLKTLEQHYNLLITVVCAYSLLTSGKLNLGVKV